PAARGGGGAGARARRAAPCLALVDGRRGPRAVAGLHRATARGAPSGGGGARPHALPRRGQDAGPRGERRGPVPRPAPEGGAAPERRGHRLPRGADAGDHRAPSRRPATRTGARLLGRRRRGRAAGADLQPGLRCHLSLPRAPDGAAVNALGIGIACFPTVGGSGVAASQLAMQLAARGHRIHVFASAVPVRLAGDGPWTVHLVESSPRPSPAAVNRPQALAQEMAAVSSRESLDVLHVHYALPHGPAALLAREQLRRQGRRAPALVTTLHAP